MSVARRDGGGPRPATRAATGLVRRAVSRPPAVSAVRDLPARLRRGERARGGAPDAGKPLAPRHRRLPSADAGPPPPDPAACRAVQRSEEQEAAAGHPRATGGSEAHRPLHAGAPHAPEAETAHTA
ncbi:hypothetical protein GCM10010964_41430 [Caldovatus sediminis]|uniref:Uncharacterized protein n=1 Tax=Caldovatus sediminis TaxID=2041189 RepID=A0A8J2ZFQ9_9PROT|nr:hypothetical protein GCM10010964_41430 [Caldovatus sediminis]